MSLTIEGVTLLDFFAAHAPEPSAGYLQTALGKRGFNSKVCPDAEIFREVAVFKFQYAAVMVAQHPSNQGKFNERQSFAELLVRAKTVMENCQFLNPVNEINSDHNAALAALNELVIELDKDF